MSVESAGGDAERAKTAVQSVAEFRVAIIGAGMAGLSAGLLLQEAGASVKVFEKSRGPGGRMSSKRVGEVALDLGAQYFTVRTPAFQRALERYASGRYAPWPAVLQIEKASGVREPFFAETRYVGTPRMSAVTRALARNLDITTGTRIHRFTQDEQQACWLIADDETRFGSFDCVLCSAPPAQTRALLVASEQAAVLHNPILQAAELLPCWAVAVAFDTPLELPYQGLQTKHPVLLWLTNNSSKPGRDNEREWWVLNASPDWSRDHKDAQPAAVQAALLNAFNDLTGCAWAEPGEVVTHRWLYARYQPQHSPGYLWFAEQRFGVIGDWLQGGRVEGAFNSASRWVNDWLAGNLDGPH